MKIRFTQRWTVRQGDGKGPTYEVGDEVKFDGAVAETYARKYISRGLAEEVTEDEPKGKARGRAEPKESALDGRSAVVIPENWRSLPLTQLLPLASSLADVPVRTAEEAGKAIEAELERRKAKV